MGFLCQGTLQDMFFMFTKSILLYCPKQTASMSQPVLHNNMHNKSLPPLFNEKIYKNGNIDILAPFIIINKPCYDLFKKSIEVNNVHS